MLLCLRLCLLPLSLSDLLYLPALAGGLVAAQVMLFSTVQYSTFKTLHYRGKDISDLGGVQRQASYRDWKQDTL